MDSIKNAVGNKMNKDAQPGNQVEGRADNAVNQEINQTAGGAGIPQQADQTLDNIADKKVNEKIPGGN